MDCRKRSPCAKVTVALQGQGDCVCGSAVPRGQGSDSMFLCHGSLLVGHVDWDGVCPRRYGEQPPSLTKCTCLSAGCLWVTRGYLSECAVRADTCMTCVCRLGAGVGRWCLVSGMWGKCP